MRVLYLLQHHMYVHLDMHDELNVVGVAMVLCCKMMRSTLIKCF